MQTILITTFVLFMITLVSATLNIHNWCNETVYFWQSNDGQCDRGPNFVCSSKAEAKPWSIPPNSTFNHQWITNSTSTSVKIAKTPIDNIGILQYEYTMGGGHLWFDLSDLDGEGGGLVGAPFRRDNVMAYPSGPGEGEGTCVGISCPAGRVCKDSYQTPDDSNTRHCPQAVEHFWIDLCLPDQQLSKRALKFRG